MLLPAPLESLLVIQASCGGEVGNSVFFSSCAGKLGVPLELHAKFVSFWHANYQYILSFPIAPNVFTHSFIDPKFKGSSKPGMGETQVMTYHEAKLFSSCELLKPNKLCVSQIQW